MDTPNTFNSQGQQPFFCAGAKLTVPELADQQAPAESSWRRVLDVILVEGKLRYLVERGE